MKRKEFIQKTSAAAFLASIGYTLQSCSDDDPKPKNTIVDLSASPFSVLTTENEWLLHPSEDILLANVGGEVLAFSSSCPHTGCTRDWTENSGNFRCRCHGSEFTFSGSLVTGPATRSLTALSVSRDGDTLTIG